MQIKLVRIRTKVGEIIRKAYPLDYKRIGIFFISQYEEGFQMYDMEVE